jgi:beta-glucosidase
MHPGLIMNERAPSLILAALLSGLAFAMPAGSAPVQPIDARVDALLAKMTIEDKIALIHGAKEPSATDQGEAGYWPGLPQYGIPPLRLADGPPGVLTRLPSTALPATMALAATFSVQDAGEDGAVIGRSARALGQQISLQPFINIHRDQTFGRAYNTYGEDPLLTGEIGAAVVRGIQAQGVMAQAKHFIGYDGSTDLVVGDQALREIYASPFQAVIDAGVSSIMCSYNRINGPYACGASDNLIGLLRHEMGFKGYVTSDWGAVHATDYLGKGLDLEMPGSGSMASYFAATPSPPTRRALPFVASGGLPEEPVIAGSPGGAAPKPRSAATSSGMLAALADRTVSQADIDRAAHHILYELARFDWLDHPPSLTTNPEPVEANAKVALATAQDAAVLLKNDGVLPLSPRDLAGLAVIGPGGGNLIAVGQVGEKALGHVERQISPLTALRAQAPPGGDPITYAVADDMDGQPVPASVLSHDGQPGLRRTDGGQDVAIDAQLEHTFKSGSPLAKGGRYEWNGVLNLASPGRYRLHLQVLGGSATLSLDGNPAAATLSLVTHGNVLQPGQDNVSPSTDGLDNVRIQKDLTAGPHTVTVTVTGDDSGAPVQTRLAWVTPEQQIADYAAAVRTAKYAKTAIVFAWSRDRPNFGLPGDQDQLIQDVAAVNPNTVVVLNASEPLTMPWLSKVRALVLMWFPGDEGGQATADVLTGKVNPGGRLPFTWPVRLQDQCGQRSGPSRTILARRGRQDPVLRGYPGRLSLVRQPEYRTALSVWVWSVLHPIQVWQPDRQGRRARHGQGRLHPEQCRGAGRRRSRAGLSGCPGECTQRRSIRAGGSGRLCTHPPSGRAKAGGAAHPGRAAL